ncbi:MAG: DnaB-like helicase C-terminal domain-containing protein [Oscillospiraceae bacterium]
MLYDVNSSRMLLGCLLQNPLLLISDKYNLDKSDFECSDCDASLFHQTLFRIILYLAKQGNKNIEAIDIYNVVENYKTERAILEENRYSEFVATIKKLSNAENVEYYYNTVKKWSLLREYKSRGYNVYHFFDEDIDKGIVDTVSIEDIITWYDIINCDIKKKFYVDKSIEEVKAGISFKQQKEDFKNNPEWGASFFSEYYNTISGGMVKSQLSIISSPTSKGKTTFCVANACKIACTELWDYDTQRFVKNPCCQHCAILYAQFEMKLLRQCVPKIVAYISGVPVSHITRGQYETGEEARVDRAIDIMEESQIYTVLMPKFTKSKLHSMLQEYKLKYNIEYFFWDYIKSGGAINSETQKENKTSTNDAQVLSALSEFIKEECVIFNIFSYSMTQCNKNIVDKTILDETAIMGSTGVSFACDNGAILLPPRKQEQQLIDTIKLSPNPTLSELKEKLIKFDSGELRKGLRVLHCYKSRFTDQETNLRILLWCDMSTGRCEDICCFSVDNTLVNISKTKLHPKVTGV